MADIGRQGGIRQLSLGLVEPNESEEEIDAKRMGRVLTPEPIAVALARWAIRSPADMVLDLSMG